MLNVHSNTNNMARLQNTYATSATDPLAALVNPITGALILNLPSDSASITRLNGKEITSSAHFYARR